MTASAWLRQAQNARTNEYVTQFALRLMWKDFGNVMQLAQEHQVPVPATAAAYQTSTIEQRRGIEDDFSDTAELT
jgi:3-hydroxyisobutyrate dehydrogenase-like beta-hydroxyacid dehydrogenase